MDIGCEIPAVATLGQEIARLREAKGWTQLQLAEAIGHKTQTTVSKWENDGQRPGKENLAKLAAALGTTVAHFRSFGGAYNRHAAKRTKRQREAAANLPVDSPVESDRVPRTPTAEEGTDTPLDPLDAALLNFAKAARERGASVHQQLMDMAYAIAMGRETPIPKSRRHSGGAS